MFQGGRTALEEALYIHSSETVHHGNRKALLATKALLRDAGLRVCVLMPHECTYTSTQDGGRTHIPNLYTDRLSIKYLLDFLSF